MRVAGRQVRVLTLLGSGGQAGAIDRPRGQAVGFPACVNRSSSLRGQEVCVVDIGKTKGALAALLPTVACKRGDPGYPVAPLLSTRLQRMQHGASTSLVCRASRELETRKPTPSFDLNVPRPASAASEQTAPQPACLCQFFDLGHAAPRRALIHVSRSSCRHRNERSEVRRVEWRSSSYHACFGRTPRMRPTCTAVKSGTARVPRPPSFISCRLGRWSAPHIAARSRRRFNVRVVMVLALCHRS